MWLLNHLPERHPHSASIFLEEKKQFFAILFVIREQHLNQLVYLNIIHTIIAKLIQIAFINGCK